MAQAFSPLPKGPCRTKISTESRFTAGKTIAVAIAKHYGEHSKNAVFFFGKEAGNGIDCKKTTAVVKYYCFVRRTIKLFLIRKEGFGGKFSAAAQHINVIFPRKDRSVTSKSLPSWETSVSFSLKRDSVAPCGKDPVACRETGAN